MPQGILFSETTVYHCAYQISQAPSPKSAHHSIDSCILFESIAISEVLNFHVEHIPDACPMFLSLHSYSCGVMYFCR